MLVFFIVPSRDSTLSFSTPWNPSKKRYFGGFCCFLFFFSKACQEHEYNMSKSIFLAEIHNVYPSWSVFSRLAFERFSQLRKFEKKKKNAKSNIWHYKGLWHTVGFPGSRMCLKLLFIFWEKKNGVSIKKFFFEKIENVTHLVSKFYIFKD